MLKRFYIAIVSMLLFFFVHLSYASHSTLRNDSFNTLPDSNTNNFREQSRTMWGHEDAQREGEILGPFIVSGGLHATSNSLTTLPFATIAHVPERVSQSSTAITYATTSNTNCWTIISGDNNGITDWARTGSGATGAYYHRCQTTQPDLPPNSAWLMQIATTGCPDACAITTVIDLRVFRTPLRGIPVEFFASFNAAIDEYNDTGDPTVLLTVSSRMHVTATIASTANTHLDIRPGGLLDVDAGVTLTLSRCPEAGARQLWIADGVDTGVVRFSTSCTTIRPEWWGVIPNGSAVTADMTRTARGINQSILACATAYVGAEPRTVGAIQFNSGVYLTNATLKFQPFCNYGGTRATVVNADASFTTYTDSRSTIIRAHTSLYTAANLGVLVYFATGDVYVHDMTFVGTGSINGNSSIGMQFGSSGTARTHENDTGQNASGMTIDRVSMYTFTKAWQSYSLNEGSFHQARFESNTVDAEFNCNLVNPITQTMEFTHSIFYGHVQGINATAGHASCTYNIKVIGGFFVSNQANASHVLYGPVTSGTSFYFEAIGTEFSHSGVNSNNFYMLGNFDNIVAMTVRCDTCTFQSGDIKYGRTSGTAVPTGLTLSNIYSRDMTVSPNIARNLKILGGTMLNSPISLSNTIEFDISSVVFESIAGTAITVATSDSSGRIQNNRFNIVGNPLTIFDNATNDGIRISDNIGITAAPLRGIFRSDSVAFASLGTPANGSEVFCTNCTVTGAGDNTCAGAGAGAKAVRINSVWRCFNAQN